jgi:hypothetical protein
MPRKAAESKLITGPLPKSGMQLGNSGVLDASTLPKPRLEEWGGWASAPQPKREAKS